MPGRFFSTANGYRYGFNGKENDNEVKGVEGSLQDYGMRIYDPRLGRFLSVDPMFKNLHGIHLIHLQKNDVIRSIDLDGLEKWIVHLYYADDNKTVKKMIISRYQDVTGKAKENNLKAHGAKVTDKDVMIMYHDKDGKQFKNSTFAEELTKEQKFVLKNGETKTLSSNGFEGGDKFYDAAGKMTTGILRKVGLVTMYDSKSPLEKSDEIDKSIQNELKSDESVFGVDIVLGSEKAKKDFGAQLLEKYQKMYPDAEINLTVDPGHLEKFYKKDLKKDSDGNIKGVGIRVNTVRKKE